MGVSESAADLGTFTGSVIGDGSTIKTALQSLETALEDGDAGTLAAANTYTDTSISNVVGAAPGVLDTLAEIASAINDDANVYTTLVSQINAVQSDVDGNEADSDAAESALSDRIDVLEADPVTKTYVDTADGLKLDASAVSAYGLTLDRRR